MHYIRFLKSPRLIDNSLRNTPSSLTAKITVTTDLGESFLWEDISFVAELVAEDGETVITKGTEYIWKGREGMRALEVSLRIPKRTEGVVRMKVRPASKNLDVENLSDVVERVVEEEEGCVVGVRSMDIGLSPLSKEIQPPLAERVFQIKEGKEELHIWEETGESIARHIWDAGLTFSSYLHTISPLAPTSTAKSKLPILEKLLTQQQNLQVLELGAGCGIVGLTLRHHFPTISSILLTDLPEASEILSLNISHPSISQVNKPKLEHQVLDWSQPLPDFASGKWDLIVVADCTYNPDVVPDLVKTLKGVTEENKRALVSLAMKVRHDSEMVFFDFMEMAGFEIVERCKIPVGVLGGEAEEVEIFVFRRNA